MSLLRSTCAALGLVAFAACAVDASEVSAELARQARVADRGVEKIARALATLEPTSRSFGEGVREVERATRELAALETDDRASEAQRLQAIVLQARAWDDTARAIDAVMAIDGGPAHPALVDALRDKSFPARIAARNSYDRALPMACAVDHAAVLEIVDGIARNGGPTLAPEHSCP